MSRHRGNRRYDVLTAIRENPRATYRELADACGIKSTSHVYYYLQQLIAEGLIQRDWRLPRAITLPGEKPIRRMDPRKNNSRATRAKKSLAGQKGRTEMRQARKDPFL